MKRTIMILSIICGGLLFINPVADAFAQNTNNQIIINEEENKVEVIDILNKEQAQELLKMYKKNVEFTYQGDESDFSALNQKGLSGFVFLPDYDTDLGFFVDKNTANIYYFHPSGYLELAL